MALWETSQETGFEHLDKVAIVDIEAELPQVINDTYAIQIGDALIEISEAGRVRVMQGDAIEFKPDVSNDYRLGITLDGVTLYFYTRGSGALFVCPDRTHQFVNGPVSLPPRVLVHFHLKDD